MTDILFVPSRVSDAIRACCLPKTNRNAAADVTFGRALRKTNKLRAWKPLFHSRDLEFDSRHEKVDEIVAA